MAVHVGGDRTGERRRAIPGSGPLRLELLGRFQLRAGDRVVLDRSWSRSKAKALVKLVALTEGRSLHRERLLDLLWPDLDPQAAASNLPKNLHHLRSALASRGIDVPLLTVVGELLVLNAAVSTDVEEFRARAREARACGDPEGYEEALALYMGDLLPEDVYEDWTRAARDALQGLRRQLLGEVARLYESAGALELASERLQDLVQADHLDEEAHRGLMRLHARLGSRHRALLQYQDCRRVLREELGIDPSEETERLHRDILQGRVCGAAASTGEPSPSTRAAALPAMYGRERELDLAADLIESTMKGRGGCLMIGGMAGIGKTRLATEVLAHSAQAGARVLSGRGYELEAAVAYQPLRDALRQLLDDGSGHWVGEAVPRSLYVKRLLPGMSSREGSVADPLLLEAELVNELVHVLTSVATQQPIVLLVEDLHAADHATLRALHVLCRSLAQQAILLIATYRSEELTTGKPLHRLVTSLRRERLAHEIVLEPLPDAAFELVVTDRLGGLPTDRSLLRTVVDAAEGNPLFATELVSALVDAGQVRLTQGRWQLHTDAQPPIPRAVQELLERRLDQLDEPTRRLLATAAVLGRSFRYNRLRAALDLTEAELLDALDRGIATNLLEETPGGYRFRHDLLRAGIYHRLTHARRRQLHRTVAAAIAGTAEPDDVDAIVGTAERDDVDAIAGTAEPDGVDAIAYHLAHSDEPWRAVAPLQQAARRAADVFANAVAGDLYEQAVRITREHRPRIAAGELAGLLEELGDLLIRIGHSRGGAARLGEALSLYEEVGDTEAVRRVRGRAALAHMAIGEVADATTLLSAHLEEWERLLVDYGGDDLAGLGPSAALHMLADLRWHSGQHREALAAAEQAVHAAETSGDSEQRARAYESFALACHSLGDWERGVAYELQRGALGLPGFTDVALDAHY